MFPGCARSSFWYTPAVEKLKLCGVDTLMNRSETFIRVFTEFVCNFDVTFGRAAREGSSATWNLGTN
jgi:hypothetical protein